MNGVAVINPGLSEICSCFPSPFCCGNSVDLPGYQLGVPMNPVAAGGNGGSAYFRNYPDVAMLASNFEIYLNGGTTGFGGTSLATPLWAGVIALANQYGETHGVYHVGFANDALYAIGKTSGLMGGADLYKTSFHDIADGVYNSINMGVPLASGYPAVSGYDLATGWGTPTCGLIQQLGTFNPTLPTNFDFFDLHLANGHDGVNDASSVTMDVYDTSHKLLHSYTLKQAGQPNWSDFGVVHDLTSLPLYDASGKQTTYALDHIGQVVLTVNENGQGGSNGDNWDLAGFGLRLKSINAPDGCLFDLSGNYGCDPNVGVCQYNGDGSYTPPDGHPAVVRFSQTCCSSGSGNVVKFDVQRDGCAAQPRGATPSQPFAAIEVVLDTGDDDLETPSELDIHIYNHNGVDVEDGVLKSSTDYKFDNDTEHSITYQLRNGPLQASDIDHIDLTMVNSGNDEWHVFGARVFGVPYGGAFEGTCLYEGRGADTGGGDDETLFRIGGSHPLTQTLAVKPGCD